MKPRMVCLIALIVSAMLLFTGCGGGDTLFTPITGEDEIAAPAAVEEARGHALDYVISSSRLAGIPSDLDWQLDVKQFEGQYRYSSGGWIMVIWSGETPEANNRIVIINTAENIYWCGYLKSDGDIVDTSFLP